MFDNLQNNQPISGFALALESNIASSKSGKPFMNLRLSDGQNTVAAKMWDYEGETPPQNTVLKIKGKVNFYQDKPQIILDKWRLAEPTEYNPADYLPAYEGELEPFWQNIIGNVDQIGNDELKVAIGSILNELKQNMMAAPAAKSNHHAYLGGLLEHTSNVLDTAISIANRYPEHIDLDLVISGAILHDIGKIQTYTWDTPQIGWTNQGHLLNHIVLGITMLEKNSIFATLPEDTKLKLFHIVSSHHGKLEWASPVEPYTKEAIIIHYADLLDSTFNHVDAAIKEGIKKGETMIYPKVFFKKIII